MLAVTGLILFHDEIDHALGVVPGASPGAASITLADAVELARDGRPGEAVFAFREPDDHPGVVFIGLAEGSRRLEDAEPVAVDLIRGVVLDEVDVTSSFIELVLELHAELFAGPWGRLLVGVVAFALLVSLVSGAIVYGPIMRRFAFGLIRRGGALRTTVADLHKLIGITTLGWSAVVAVTGLMLSLGSVLLQVYSMTELAALGAPYAHEPIVTDVTSIDRAVRSAEASSEGRTWTVVALPGSDLASPRHYTILLQGGKGLDARLLTMA
ncbi:MAG: PepSY-associated TM helix domain-containing protein, partial [Myxococcota bacterium]